MDNTFMKIAIKNALKAYYLNEIPVGCVIIKNGKVIGEGYNIKDTSNISTNHAEIISINNSCLNLNSWRLNDSSMYVTLEPCLMCAGAIFESRIKNLYIGTPNPLNGFFSTNYHKPNLKLNITWVNNPLCQYILDRFIKKIRKGSEWSYPYPKLFSI